MMDPHRKQWNERQKKLQEALKRSESHAEAVDLFLSQHAAVHARSASGIEDWSFEEEIWDGLSEFAARRMVGEHSIAWVFWHLARIEDVTMNVLLSGSEQVFSPRWQARLGVDCADTGNALPVETIADLSARVDLAALREYRSAVASRTRALVWNLTPALLRMKVDSVRIEMLRRSGHILPEAAGLLDYWGGRTLAGLLLMPPTRHCFLHLNEAARIKKAASA